MSDLPTPEELGDKLKAGEITKEQAIEIMSERARAEALGGLYGPPPEQAKRDPEADAKATRALRAFVFTMAVLAVALAALLIWVAWKRAQ